MTVFKIEPSQEVKYEVLDQALEIDIALVLTPNGHRQYVIRDMNREICVPDDVMDLISDFVEKTRNG